MLPILLALAFIIFLFGVIVSGRPDEFTVSRSIKVSASPDRVFSHVNELRKWEDWSPWAKLDPHAMSAFDGPVAGDGAAMSWDGNQKVGAGRMTIVASRPSDMIRIRLEFLRPFKATNTAEFRFHSEDAQTVVTWSMSGQNNLFFKAFSLLMNCDDIAGRDFEKGLTSLKAVAEE